MRKRAYIVLAVLFAFAMGLATWEASRTHEQGPVYQGKPLGYWIERSGQYPGPVANVSAFPPHLSGQTLPRVDSNAVPYLIKALDRHDGRIRHNYCTVWRKLPTWAQKWLPKPFLPVYIRLNAVEALGEIGPGAKRAIPALSRVATGDKVPVVRWLAVGSLGRIGIEEQGARLALVEALQDRASLVSYTAMLVLAGDRMAEGNPTNTLVQLLRDSDHAIRSCASNVLRRMDPVLAASAGISTNAPGL